MPAWYYQSLGRPRLDSGEQQLFPERKTAALLACLALRGPASRSRLAGLLWPASSEATARNNLAQLLARLRRASGAQLVAGDDPLQLAGQLTVDVSELRVAAFNAQHMAVIASSGLLLETFDYDDCSELSDWLYTEREALLQLRRSALHAEISAQETAGRLTEALQLAGQLLELEPVAEEPYRKLMRLHYLNGDRAQALQVFQRCEETLERELGVTPLPETLALAAEIRRAEPHGPLQPEPLGTRREALPLSVLRPPRLIGRQLEWQQLEEAAAKGRPVFLLGEAGVGKTRLLADFAAGGPVLQVAGRPGDEVLPYATVSRAWRAVLPQLPPGSLAPWVKAELARLLPELSEQAGAKLPEGGDRLRLFEAQARLLAAARDAGYGTLLAEDLHWVDAASFDTLIYLAGSAGGAPRFLASCRSGTLTPAQFDVIRQSAARGDLELITLQPLDEDATAELLDSLALAARRLPDASALHRSTGGNPFFMLELLRNELELADGPSPRVAPALPARVAQLLQQRLERLSEPARKLAWAAAVAAAEFTFELGSSLLGVTPLDLAGAWEELERAQVLTGGTFTHDLLHEAVRADVPGPVRQLLHRRCAALLEAGGHDPGLIARHHLAAGDDAAAAPHLLRAGDRARDKLELEEADRAYAQAAALLEGSGAGRAELFAACRARALLLVEHGLGAEAEQAAACRRARQLALGDLEQAQALHLEAALLARQAAGRDSEAAARAGLAFARSAGGAELQAQLLSSLGEALYLQGEYQAASAAFQEAFELCRDLGDSSALAGTLLNLAFANDLLDRPDLAAGHYRAAAEMCGRIGDTAALIIVRTNQGFSIREAGRARDSLAPLAEALELLEDTTGTADDLRRVHGHLGEAFTQLGSYAAALGHLEQALALSSAAQLPAAFLQVSFAKLLLQLGQHDRCESLLEQLLAQDGVRGRMQGSAWMVRARLQLAAGRPAAAGFARAAELLETQRNEFAHAKILLLASVEQEPAAALAACSEALALVEQRSFSGLRAAALTRKAQALLRLQRPREALRFSGAAQASLREHDPLDFYLPEIRFTHYLVLDALAERGAGAELRACSEWVGAAAGQLPAEYRKAFLTLNPVNRLIHAAAGLPVILQSSSAA